MLVYFIYMNAGYGVVFSCVEDTVTIMVRECSLLDGY